MPKVKKDKHKQIGRQTPFKNPNFLLKKCANKSIKTFKQIIQAENYECYPASAPNYVSIEAAPSTLPNKKYSDISGHMAKYTEPKTGLRFSTPFEFQIIRQLTQEHIEAYLALRKAVTIIR
jgi:INO80 complex subunit C